MFTRANTPFSVTVVVIGCRTPVEVGRTSSGTEIGLLSLVCEWKHTTFAVVCSLLTCNILVSIHCEKSMRQKYKRNDISLRPTFACDTLTYCYACHKMFGKIARIIMIMIMIIDLFSAKIITYSKAFYNVRFSFAVKI